MAAPSYRHRLRWEERSLWVAGPVTPSSRVSPEQVLGWACPELCSGQAETSLGHGWIQSYSGHSDKQGAVVENVGY